jgi:hypothetical protein
VAEIVPDDSSVFRRREGDCGIRSTTGGGSKHEPATPIFRIAALLMAAGGRLHLTEWHEHEHVHEAVSHAHPHRHDSHAQPTISRGMAANRTRTSISTKR